MSCHVSVFVFAERKVRGGMRDYIFGLSDLTLDKRNKEKKVKPLGGMVEYGEFLGHAVIREAGEESDHNVTIKDQQSLVLTFRGRPDKGNHRRISYLATETDIETKVRFEPGSSVTFIDSESGHTFKLRLWGLKDFLIHLCDGYWERYFFTFEKMMKYQDFRERNQKFFDEVLVKRNQEFIKLKEERRNRRVHILS
ncbi:MAG: hypothetical protein WCX27_00650 [Candidatus Paceibacterota bacterium]|jgi:ADP-ribose pyrophosphatase YjhB (NUDIX family)